MNKTVAHVLSFNSVCEQNKFLERICQTSQNCAKCYLEQVNTAVSLPLFRVMTGIKRILNRYKIYKFNEMGNIITRGTFKLII